MCCTLTPAISMNGRLHATLAIVMSGGQLVALGEEFENATKVEMWTTIFVTQLAACSVFACHWSSSHSKASRKR